MQEVFEISGFTAIFTIYDSRQKAIEALRLTSLPDAGVAVASRRCSTGWWTCRRARGDQARGNSLRPRRAAAARHLLGIGAAWLLVIMLSLYAVLAARGLGLDAAATARYAAASLFWIGLGSALYGFRTRLTPGIPFVNIPSPVSLAPTSL